MKDELLIVGVLAVFVMSAILNTPSVSAADVWGVAGLVAISVFGAVLLTAAAYLREDV